MKYQQETKEHIVEDAEGNITTTTTTKTKAILKNDEPDYIKLYTKMWCEFNAIPDKWRPLFFALVCRMSYASLKDETGGQIVHTIGSTGKAIIEECGWKNKDTLYRGLQALCECEAIKKISRGEYQINPQYAGKGPWHYNAKENRGGVSELVAKFDFKNKKVNTKIVWASTDKQEIGRNADEVVILEKHITPEQLPGQMTMEFDNDNIPEPEPDIDMSEQWEAALREEEAL